MDHELSPKNADFFDRLNIVAMDKDNVRMLFADAEDVFNSAIFGFVQEYAQAFEQIEEQITQDKVAALRYVHTLKGLCGTLGLMELAQYFAELEQAIKSHEDWSIEWVDQQQVQQFERVIQSMREHCQAHGVSE